MGLRLWLPLNGDLINRGLEPGIKVTNNQNLVTFASNGKLGGQCAQFNSTSKNCYLQTNYYTNFGTNNFSIAFWIKIDADNVPDNYTHIVSSKGWGASDSGVCIAYFKGDDSTEATLMFRTSGQRIGCPITNFSNKWIHFIAIRDNTVSKNVRFFVNGIATEPSGSMTIVNTGNTAFRIGIDTNKHYFPASMQIQDVRIYDHALSDKEAKELAKGLVLHYKLGYGDIESTTNLCKQLVAGGQTTVTNNIITHNGTNSDTYWYIKPLEALVGGATYTVSCYLSGFANDTDWIRWGVGAQSGDNSAGNWTTYNGYNSFTFTMPAGKDGSTANFIFDDSNGGTGRSQVFTISNVQLEKKDHATAFTDYGTTRTAITEIKDVSGYGNDGIIVGTPTVTTDTLRYNFSTVFNGSNTAIKVVNNKWMSQGMEAMTINLWVKASSWPANIKFFSCTETGGFNTESGTSGYWRFPVHVYTNAEKTTTAYKYDSKEIQISALSTTDWNMITYVYSTAGTRTYINGQLHHTYNNTSYGIHFNTNARLFLGCEANTANPTTPYFNGQESDFRLYVTALSPEDIKELYETSTSIDNKSNIYSRQFEETNLNKISITNRGQLQMDAIEEDSSTASFYKDTKEVKGQLIYEY